MKKKTHLSKVIPLTLLMTLMLLALGACGATADPSANEPLPADSPASDSSSNDVSADTAAGGGEGTTITFWNGFTASDGDILREIVDRYNATNAKGITVEIDIMPWGNMLEKLAPAIATNTGPALILLGSDTIPEYADSGGLIEMDDFWAISGLDQSNYAQNVQDAFAFKGCVYGIPMQFNTNYLYWNKDIFIEAGLDPDVPPRNMSELVEYAAKLTDKSKEQYGFGIALGNINITNFLWSNGGDWLSADQTRAACDSPEMIKTLSMLQNFAIDGVTPIGMSGADLDNLLYAGQLGLYINGPWLINGCRENNLNFGIGAVPGADNGHLQVPGGGVAYMVTSSASEAEKAAAYDFIAYWLSDEVLTEWTLRNGFPAWSKTVLADPAIQADPIQKVLGPLSDYGRIPFNGMPEYGQMAGDYLDPLFEQLMYDMITPEDCARQMAEGIDAVLGN